MRHNLPVRNDRSRVLVEVAMVAFCVSLVASRRDDSRLGNSVHRHRASPQSFNFFSLLRSERLAGHQKLGSLDVQVVVRRGNANSHRRGREGVHHAALVLLQSVGGPFGHLEGVIQRHILGLRQRAAMQFPEGEDQFCAPLLLPVHVQTVLWHLREPPSRGITNVRKPQTRVDSGRSGEYGKPISYGRLQASMNAQQQCIIERPLVQIVEVNANSGSSAARGATSHFIHLGEEGIVEHSLLAPEFCSVSHYWDFALELIDGEIHAFAFQGTERSFNPIFQVVEMDSLRFKQLQVRATGILENTLFDEVQKVLIASRYTLLNGTFRQGNGFLWRHSLLRESAKTLNESVVLSHRKFAGRLRRLSPIGSSIARRPSPNAERSLATFHCLRDMEERGTFVTKKPGHDHAVSPSFS